MIPYGKQEITEEDIESVVDVLRSEYITQGPAISRFENAVANYCNAEYSIATNSATSALHIACQALGLGVNDWLWTSPNTFVASANCGLYCGAKVDFVDIDSRSYNMSVDALKLKLESAEREGRLPKIIVVVHFAGQSCEMKAIHQLSKKYGFFIIEDASHAIGGRYLDKPIGGCQYSDVTIFSFHPVKIITTAEGGMALTNNEELADSMKQLRSHGITRDEELMTIESEGGWYYQQLELGFNYRITDIQAALGTSQIRRLDDYIEKRHKIKNRYDESLAEMPIVVPWQHPDCYSSLHLYPIQVSSESKSRRDVFETLRGNDIGVNVHYIPVHTQPYYQKMGFKQNDFPVALAYYQRAISLPMYSSLTIDEQDQVIAALRKAIQ